jgi:AcrR family transcriptional regulator
MSPRTKEQYEKIRESSRTEILDAALKLFAQNGFHATSISQIAEKAGISKGLMYNYFKSKDDLLRTIIDDGFKKLGFLMAEINTETDPRKALEKIIRLSLQNLKNNLEYWKLYMSIVLQSTSQKDMEEHIASFRDSAVMGLSELLKAMGQKDYYLKAFALGSQLDGLAFNVVSAPGSLPIDELEEYLIETYCSPAKKKRKKK